MSNLKYSLLFISALVAKNVFAQIPTNDQGWEMFFQDEFNNPNTLNTVWEYHYPWTNCLGITALTNNLSNRRVNNGYLELTILKEITTCTDYVNSINYQQKYSSGAIYSRQKFKYGFFETKFKLTPANNNVKGIGPNFWMYPFTTGTIDAYSPKYTNTRTSELDVVELINPNYTYTYNIHSKIDTAAPKLHSNFELNPGNPGNVWTNDFRRRRELDFNVEHKFACDWTPNYIIFYLDDEQIQISDYPLIKDLIHMNLIIDINLPVNLILPDQNTQFPFKFLVDYVKVYKLMEDCSNDVLPENFNYATFDHKVKKSILIAGNNGLMQIGQNISIRANEFIKLDDGFEVPIGAEFYANNYECDCEIKKK